MIKNVIRKIVPLHVRLQVNHVRQYARLLNPLKESASKKFILYASGRSGSTLLTSLLNSHPDIYCDGEIFANKYVPTIYSPYLYLEAMAKKATELNKKVYGCGLMSTQLKGKKLDQRAFLEDLAINRGWSIIHLRRENILDVVISLLNAKINQQWFLKKGEKFKESAVLYDVEELKYWIEHHLELYAIEDNTLKDLPYYKIVYETDLLDNTIHQVTMDKIFSFLDLPIVEVNTELDKKLSLDYRKKLSNYQEIVTMLVANGYSRFLSNEK